MTTVHNVRGGFTAVPNSAVRDGRLSFRALGVLAYLAEKPPGWSFASERIARDGAGREGRDAVRTAMRELADAGYVRHDRTRDEAGQVRTRILVDVLGELSTGDGNPGAGSPGAGFPGAKGSTTTRDHHPPLPPREGASPMEATQQAQAVRMREHAERARAADEADGPPAPPPADLRAALHRNDPL